MLLWDGTLGCGSDGVVCAPRAEVAAAAAAAAAARKGAGDPPASPARCRSARRRNRLRVLAPSHPHPPTHPPTHTHTHGLQTRALDWSSFPPFPPSPACAPQKTDAGRRRRPQCRRARARDAPVEVEKDPALQSMQTVAPAARVVCVCARACRTD